ncbi:hypothetical protein [Nocardioides campestrisoli]|uniref:hypothetical protein n=1 Tax=Nocardioides campestrisoli TaxID=2736757 RepID=UPI0015E6C916|nr:hypothetical protein [Nocardioides campestrisoli]
MQIRVIHGIDDLASDLAAMPARLAAGITKTTRANVAAGARAARKFAQASSGPHGANYYKRITGEMTGAASGEWGPEGVPKTEFVGAGYRNGPGNRDLPNSADLIGPKYSNDLGDVLEELFW